MLQDHLTEANIDQLMSGIKGLTLKQERQLRILLWQYRDIILLGDHDIGRTKIVRHFINTEGADPIRQPLRRLPFHRRQEVKHLVDSILERGVIEKSQGPWSSPIVLVKKKDGSTRFCVDFRCLNHVTKKDAQPLPRLDETLDQLSGTAWFSTLQILDALTM